MFEDENIDFDEKLEFLRRGPKPAKLLDDSFFIALTRDILDGKQPTVTRKEVLQAIAFGSVSNKVVEDVKFLTLDLHYQGL